MFKYLRHQKPAITLQNMSFVNVQAHDKTYQVSKTLCLTYAYSTVNYESYGLSERENKLSLAYSYLEWYKIIDTIHTIVWNRFTVKYSSI